MTQKEIAIQCLEKLDIYKPYIRKFKSQQTLPCFFENYGGFWVDQEPELYNKIKEVEKNGEYLVYAVTHEIIADMEGHVHIYALMEDGSIASETIKDMIAETKPLLSAVKKEEPNMARPANRKDEE